MLNLIARFVRNDSGAAGVEYGLLVALIAAVIVVTVATVGQEVLLGFQSVCSSLKTALGTAAASAGNC